MPDRNAVERWRGGRWTGDATARGDVPAQGDATARGEAPGQGVAPAPGTALAITVLGSGGPFTHPRRASSAYVVWLDGVPRLLVDAGGGTFERLGRVGVDPATLDAVLLTHTHIDHSGGLAPVVFAAFMQGRRRPLPVMGPSGRDGQPGCGRFCDLLFGTAGAWRYLHSFEGFGIAAGEVPEEAGDPVPLAVAGLRVQAVGVRHGMMPAVAYRIDHGHRSVVVTGDLEGTSAGLVALAKDCDVLVHDQALPERQLPHGHLHPPPEETGANAAAAGATTLVLSHFMPPTEGRRREVTRRVASRFSGRVALATDLLTVAA